MFTAQPREPLDPLGDVVTADGADGADGTRRTRRRWLAACVVGVLVIGVGIGVITYLRSPAMRFVGEWTLTNPEHPARVVLRLGADRSWKRFVSSDVYGDAQSGAWTIDDDELRLFYEVKTAPLIDALTGNCGNTWESYTVDELTRGRMRLTNGGRQYIFVRSHDDRTDDELGSPGYR